ncbi:unnamed protein product, partial [Didymodactylos carnosus]
FLGKKKSSTVQIPERLSLPDINERRSERNEEDITLLLFYDGELTENSDLITLKGLLRSVNDYVQFYNDEDECLEYSRSIEEEKIFIIIDGPSAEKILPRIHTLEQIVSIFLYRTNSNYESLINDYPKIVALCTDQQELIKEIRTAIEQVIKQTAAFSLYDQTEKSTRDLTKESGSFLFFQLFKQILLAMPKTDKDRREMISKCRDYYRGNRKEVNNINEFEETYKFSEAIQWYTKDAFVYRLVNKSLRTEDIEALYSLRYYISDLCLQLAMKHKEFIKSLSSMNLTLYRGFKASKNDMQIYKNNVGNLISTNGFLSTSVLREVAYDFARKPSKRKDIEALLIEIHVDLNLVKTIVLADISKYSIFANEKEILFDL